MALKVYVGWDQRDLQAYAVCLSSLFRTTNHSLDVRPLRETDLRRKGCYWRPYHVSSGSGKDGYNNGQMICDVDGKPFSTGFSFTRFLVPYLENYRDEWVLFLDADMLIRSDISELFSFADDSHAVFVVQHDYQPKETVKMDGVAQERYFRKNWSSVLLMNPARCNALTPQVVNNATGSYLHGFHWLEDDRIGELPAEWNFLCGHHDPTQLDPKIVHYTRGDPSMGYRDEPFSDEWFKEFDEADYKVVFAT